MSGASSLAAYGDAEVPRRVGAQLHQFQAPAALRQYQLYMGGVDRNDQFRENGAGFFKGIKKTGKWYQKVLLAFLDIGVVQASIAHNMFAESPRGMNAGLRRTPIYVFQRVLARDLLKIDFDEDRWA